MAQPITPPTSTSTPAIDALTPLPSSRYLGLPPLELRSVSEWLSHDWAQTTWEGFRAAFDEIDLYFERVSSNAEHVRRLHRLMDRVYDAFDDLVFP